VSQRRPPVARSFSPVSQRASSEARNTANAAMSSGWPMALTECAGRELTDPAAKLATGMLLATWSVAFMQAHHIFRQTRDTTAANAAFLAIVDQGTVGLKAAMSGTRYA
jgi:hypothetical protein